MNQLLVFEKPSQASAGFQLVFSLGFCSWTSLIVCFAKASRFSQTSPSWLLSRLICFSLVACLFSAKPANMVIMLVPHLLWIFYNYSAHYKTRFWPWLFFFFFFIFLPFLLLLRLLHLSMFALLCGVFAFRLSSGLGFVTGKVKPREGVQNDARKPPPLTDIPLSLFHILY